MDLEGFVEEILNILNSKHDTTIERRELLRRFKERQKIERQIDNLSPAEFNS